MALGERSSLIAKVFCGSLILSFAKQLIMIASIA
ncbi:MAG: hypothetical protein QOH71_1078 [Blastocatellia bacterium]|jgi:hypothetical protein|nr:hypothetical protein [Blastocatellia bacterium]